MNGFCAGILRASARLCYRRWPVLLLPWLLSACQPAPAGLIELSDYQARVARPQSLTPLSIELPRPPVWPTVRSLQVSEPKLDISLLELWRWDECPAMALITERNSSLGRLQQGLRRYYQDLRLLEGLQQCAQNSKLPAAMRTALASHAAALRSALPARRLNAIATEIALQKALSYGASRLDTLSSAALAPQLDALTRVVTLLRIEVEPTRMSLADSLSFAQLETALATLEQQNYLAAYWRTMFDTEVYLAALKPLTAELSERGGCFASRQGVPQRAEVLQRVFAKFFASNVQPRLAQLSSHAVQLEPVLQLLLATELSSPLRQHLMTLVTLDARLKQTTLAHVRDWQAFFRDCDFIPGTNVAESGSINSALVSAD